MAGYDRLTQGAGSLNLVGALELAEKIDPEAAVGTTWLTAPFSGRRKSTG